jgi:hypothetical protein
MPEISRGLSPDSNREDTPGSVSLSPDPGRGRSHRLATLLAFLESGRPIWANRRIQPRLWKSRSPAFGLGCQLISATLIGVVHLVVTETLGIVPIAIGTQPPANDFDPYRGPAGQKAVPLMELSK